MAQTIEIGTILIKDGTHLPETLLLESDPYLKGWRLVKNLILLCNGPETLRGGMDLFLHGR